MFSVIEKIKRSHVSLTEEETLAIAKIISSEEELKNYYVAIPQMFSDEEAFDLFLHNFLSVWAKVVSSDGIEIPTYEPFAIGYARGVKDAEIEIWVSWYSNCIIIHIEKDTEETQMKSSWVLIDRKTHDEILEDSGSWKAALVPTEKETDNE